MSDPIDPATPTCRRGGRFIVATLLMMAIFVSAILSWNAHQDLKDSAFRAYLAAHGVPAAGTIRDFIPGQTTQKGTSSGWFTFDFTTRDGRRIEAAFSLRHELNAETAAMTPGAPITVFYDPADPKRAMPTRSGTIPQRSRSDVLWELGRNLLLCAVVLLWMAWRALRRAPDDSA